MQIQHKWYLLSTDFPKHIDYGDHLNTQKFVYMHDKHNFTHL